MRALTYQQIALVGSGLLHFDCVVVPVDDLSVPDEEYSNAVPGLDCEIREIVNPLVNYHRSSRKRVEHIKTIDVVKDCLDTG